MRFNLRFNAAAMRNSRSCERRLGMASTPVACGIALPALAAEWRQLTRAAQEAGISDADRNVLIERADALLERLAEMSANTEALQVAETLIRSVARDG